MPMCFRRADVLNNVMDEVTREETYENENKIVDKNSIKDTKCTT